MQVWKELGKALLIGAALTISLGWFIEQARAAEGPPAPEPETVEIDLRPYSSGKWDVVTSAGIFYKDLSGTDYIALSDCGSVLADHGGTRDIRTRSCGGDNPAFLGCPLGARKQFLRGAVSLYLEYCHLSHWGTPADEELNINMVGARAEWNISQFIRNRR